MKRPKRLALCLSFFMTCLTILPASITPATTIFADVALPLNDTKYVAALNFMDGLGIDTSDPDGKVTRAQVAKIIDMAVGYNPTTQTTTPTMPFKDVGKDHWAAKYIALASERGLIKGTSKDTFSPEDNATYAQFATMTVRALGYQDTDLVGSWPLNYLAKAVELDLSKNVNLESKTPLRNSDAAILTRNALSAKFSPNAENGKAGKTMLENLIDQKLISDEVAKALLSITNPTYQTPNGKDPSAYVSSGKATGSSNDNLSIVLPRLNFTFNCTDGDFSSKEVNQIDVTALATTDSLLNITFYDSSFGSPKTIGPTETNPQNYAEQIRSALAENSDIANDYDITTYSSIVIVTAKTERPDRDVKIRITTGSTPPIALESEQFTAGTSRVCKTAQLKIISIPSGPAKVVLKVNNTPITFNVGAENTAYTKESIVKTIAALLKEKKQHIPELSDYSIESSEDTIILTRISFKNLSDLMISIDSSPIL